MIPDHNSIIIYIIIKPINIVEPTEEFSIALFTKFFITIAIEFLSNLMLLSSDERIDKLKTLKFTNAQSQFYPIV